MSASTVAAPSAFPLRRVLIVDGSADTREMYREFFQESGWAVMEARDGREALVMACKERPSIVVTELWLPIIDGVTLCRLFRQDAAMRAVPILVVSSESRANYLKQAERAGAMAVLLKPSTPNVVVAEMERLTRTTRMASTSTSAYRRTLVKAHERFETTSPDHPAPELFCPVCTVKLNYQKTFFGGVSSRHPERWDYLRCVRCGEFSYRHRTRKLRHIC